MSVGGLGPAVDDQQAREFNALVKIQDYLTEHHIIARRAESSDRFLATLQRLIDLTCESIISGMGRPAPARTVEPRNDLQDTPTAFLQTTQVVIRAFQNGATAGVCFCDYGSDPRMKSHPGSCVAARRFMEAIDLELNRRQQQKGSST